MIAIDIIFESEIEMRRRFKGIVDERVSFARVRGKLRTLEVARLKWGDVHKGNAITIYLKDSIVAIL